MMDSFNSLETAELEKCLQSGIVDFEMALYHD